VPDAAAAVTNAGVRPPAAASRPPACAGGGGRSIEPVAAAGVPAIPESQQ